MSTNNRKLTTIYRPASSPGFLGKGHIARPVIEVGFSQSDPFIMMMDDMLDKTDSIPVGGPHPHAGFETVTLVLEGELGEGHESLRAGDLEIMTAGSGIVHTEIIAKPMKMRILQLWLNLPKKERKAMPRLQRLASTKVPTASKDGALIRVYSGSMAGVKSPIENYTQLLIAEVQLEANARVAEQIPADFTGFIYVIHGQVSVGDDQQTLVADQVGWLDRGNDKGESNLIVSAGNKGARFVLFAAEPQRHEIVSHGPFIADSMDDIRDLYSDFRAGRMGHISEVNEAQHIIY